ncbi:MAG: hypothetical protein AAGG68_15155 [Bacteroidota bacterium]
MKKKLEEHIVERLGKRPENLDLVLSHFKEKQVKKNEVLVEVNQVCRHCYFIAKGCLKVTTHNINFEESTTNLAFEQE